MLKNSLMFVVYFLLDQEILVIKDFHAHQVLLAWPCDWRHSSRESFFQTGRFARTVSAPIVELVHYSFNCFIIRTWESLLPLYFLSIMIPSIARLQILLTFHTDACCSGRSTTFNSEDQIRRLGAFKSDQDSTPLVGRIRLRWQTRQRNNSSYKAETIMDDLCMLYLHKT